MPAPGKECELSCIFVVMVSNISLFPRFPIIIWNGSDGAELFFLFSFFFILSYNNVDGIDIGCNIKGRMYVIIGSHFVPLEGKFLLIALIIVRITLNVIVRQ